MQLCISNARLHNSPQRGSGLYVSRNGTELSPRTGIGIDTCRGTVRNYPRERRSVSTRVAERYRITPADGNRCRKCRGAPLATSSYEIMKSTGAPVAYHKEAADSRRGTSRSGAWLRIRRVWWSRDASHEKFVSSTRHRDAACLTRKRNRAPVVPRDAATRRTFS